MLQSVVLVQHMFMYTISFAEKQGGLFLNKPRDIKHRKDALSQIQRVGIYFHIFGMWSVELVRSLLQMLLSN